MKPLHFFFLIVSARLLSGCGVSTGTTPGNNRDTSYYFLKDSAFQPVRRDGTSGATELIVGDFTDDTYDDLIVLTESAGMVFYRNLTGEGFLAGDLIGVTPANYNFAAVYNSGLVLAESGTGSLRVLNNTSGFSLNASYLEPRVSAATQVVVSGPVVAVMTESTHLIAEIGASAFQDVINLTDVFPGSSGRVQAGRINNDSLDDFMFVANSGSQAAKFYRRTSSGVQAATASVNRASSSNVNDFVLANFTGSDAVDALLLTSAGLELLENQSTASIVLQNRTLLGDVSAVGSQLIAGDFLRQDGLNDVYLIRASGKGVLLSRSAADSLLFEDITAIDGFATSDQGSGPVDVVKGDFDGDNRLDIAELYSNGSIRVYMNTAKAD
jgi:hypothetical protein